MATTPAAPPRSDHGHEVARSGNGQGRLASMFDAMDANDQSSGELAALGSAAACGQPCEGCEEEDFSSG